MKKYYEILEVNPKASKEIIERAYRVLVKKYHPDLYEGEKRIYAEEKIRDINEAYKILSDEFLREQYDVELQKEMKYDYLYKDVYKQEIERNVKRINETEEIEEDIPKRKKEKSDIGTYKGIISIPKMLFKNKPKLKDIRELKREDYIAIGLTAIIAIVVGIILWFIPATNGFIRDMIPFIQ